MCELNDPLFSLPEIRSVLKLVCLLSDVKQVYHVVVAPKLQEA